LAYHRPTGVRRGISEYNCPGWALGRIQGGGGTAASRVGPGRGPRFAVAGALARSHGTAIAALRLGMTLILRDLSSHRLAHSRSGRDQQRRDALDAPTMTAPDYYDSDVPALARPCGRPSPQPNTAGRDPDSGTRPAGAPACHLERLGSPPSLRPGAAQALPAGVAVATTRPPGARPAPRAPGPGRGPGCNLATQRCSLDPGLQLESDLETAAGRPAAGRPGACTRLGPRGLRPPPAASPGPGRPGQHPPESRRQRQRRPASRCKCGPA
jgi:hypothetical protein